MECSLCMCVFDHKARRPKCLPCGHTYCLECLKHPNFGKSCPMDRKPLKGRVDDLPDSFSIMKYNGDSATKSPAFWCRTCNDQFTNDCAVGDHKPHTLGWLRTERLEPQVRKLQGGADAARRLGEHLTLVQQDLQRQTETSRSQLQKIEAALSQLKKAESDLSNMKTALEVADTEVQQVPQIEKNGQLLDMDGAVVRVTLERPDNTDIWRADVELKKGTEHLVRHVLVQLLSENRLFKLKKIEERKQENQKANTATVQFNQAHVEWNEIGFEKYPLEQVPRITGLNCSLHPDLSLQLLKLAASKVIELELYEVKMEHLLVVRTMRQLRKLSMSLTEGVLKEDCPGLPLHLEELEIIGVSRKHMNSVAFMTRLRRLTLHNYTGADVVFPALTADQHGLQFLSIGATRMHKSTVLTLIRAHAATLQEIQVVQFEPDDKRHFGIGFENCWWPELALLLSNIKLIVLLRKMRVSFHEVWGSHGPECRKEVEMIRRFFPPRKDAKGQVVSVSVVCKVCSEAQHN